MRQRTRNASAQFFLASFLLTLGSNPTLWSAEKTRDESKPAAKPVSLNSTKPDLPSPSSELVQALLSLHNEARARQGLAALRLHPSLTAAAQRYAEFAHRTRSFGHEADGRSPADRIAAEGLRHGSWAENMAQGQQNPAAAMHTWMNSSAHRGNILSQHAYVGFGKVGGIWVTVFANLLDGHDAAEHVVRK
jgi:uncharacterized protein YkwD